MFFRRGHQLQKPCCASGSTSESEFEVLGSSQVLLTIDGPSKSPGCKLIYVFWCYIRDKAGFFGAGYGASKRSHSRHCGPREFGQVVHDRFGRPKPGSFCKRGYPPLCGQALSEPHRPTIKARHDKATARVTRFKGHAPMFNMMLLYFLQILHTFILHQLSSISDMIYLYLQACEWLREPTLTVRCWPWGIALLLWVLQLLLSPIEPRTWQAC